ncbi:MAG: hypothetical protein LBH35_06030 [Treponema sp.]|jgi:hypothetical protein|nr:hypothetical protein [Treponema sp.]
MRKTPSIVALFCILVYTASVVFAAYRIYRGIGRQKETAEMELDGIAGLVSRDVFFEENGGDLIQERLRAGEALEGIIITGSAGSELAFEKEPGRIVVRNGTTPGFAGRPGTGYLPAKQVDVSGLRNVNIYAAYNVVDYALFVKTLKQSLAAILAALLVAFLTLILSSILKKENAGITEEAGIRERAEPDEASPETARTESTYSETSYAEETSYSEDRAEEADEQEDLDDDFDFTTFSEPEDGESFGETETEKSPGGFDGSDEFSLDDFLDEDTLEMPGEEPSAETDAGPGEFYPFDESDTGPGEPGEFYPFDESDTGSGEPGEFYPPGETDTESPEPYPSAKTDAGPRGLYSPKSGIGWEDYTIDRLASEIHRCAASEQDLVMLLFECEEVPDGEFYKKLAGEAVRFFNLKDLTFEKGNRGISVIIPNTDLDHGIIKAEEFHARVLKNLPDGSKTALRAGLSSRSGRLINADRLFFEAASALGKAEDEQPIVAFKSNPEKYREFIRKSQI